MTRFIQLNADWNAEPNAPEPAVRLIGSALVLEFTLNSQQFPRFAESQRGRLIFQEVSCFRIGPTNDEGWYRGQCRFSRSAPEWGEFYELSGDLLLDACREGWTTVLGGPVSEGRRHFLFYLRDQTFECQANDWRFEAD